MPLPWSQEGILRVCLSFREEGELVSYPQLPNVYFHVPFVWAWRREQGTRKGGTAVGWDGQPCWADKERGGLGTRAAAAGRFDVSAMKRFNKK